MRKAPSVPSTSLIQYSLSLDRKIRGWLMAGFCAFFAVYFYVSAVQVQDRVFERRELRQSLARADAYDRIKLASLLDRNSDQLARDLAVRTIPFVLCAALLFFILNSLKSEFRDFLSEIGSRERLLKSKDRSKQLILESLSEGILEFDLQSATWVTISGKFLEIFYGSRTAAVPLEFLENGLRAWVNLAPIGARENLSQRLLELSRRAGSETLRVPYDLPGQGPRTLELRIFSRLKGKSRRGQSGLIAISHRDISDLIRLEDERTRQERTLAETNDRMRFALDSMKLAIWEWDFQSDLIVWDEKSRELFEFFESRDPTFGDFLLRVHPEDRPVLKSTFLESMRARSYLDVNYRILREDNEIRHVRSRGKIQVDAQGNPIKMTGLNSDITEETQRERAFQDAKSRQVSSAKLAAVGEMASGIAHEINNPLTVIGAKAMMIGRRALKPQDAETAQATTNDIKAIEDNVFRISKIVKGLKIFSRDGERDPMDDARIASIVEDALGFCTEKFKLHRVELELVNELHEDRALRCRSTQIAQILLNLVNNAFDATTGQAERRVSVRVFEERGNVHLLVADNGPGVPAEIAERIMQPFFTTKEVGKGSGLGLSISHSIARDHGGELFLDRKRGNSCFHLALPIAQTSLGVEDNEELKAG